MMPSLRCVAASMTLMSASTPAARELASHQIPEVAQVGGRTLVLNGAGVRQKLLFRVYVCALYLEERSSDAAAILAADRAWQVVLHFTRNVSHHQVLDAFTEAFEHNSPGKLPVLRADLEKFHAVMEDLRQGQDLSISYVPGVGTTLQAPSGASATVPGRSFGQAILRTWLGDHPSDDSLKDGMLGR